MKRLALVFWTLAGFLVLVQVACSFGHSSNASAVAWEPYLVLKTADTRALEAVSAFESRHRQREDFPSFIHEAVAALAGSPACPGIGTVSPPQGSDTAYHATSCSGVLYSLIACPDGSACVVAGLSPGEAILFDTSGCTGTEAVSPNFSTFSVPSIGLAAVAPGALFRYDPTGTGPTDPSTYLMLAPNETGASFTVNSEYVYGSGCQPVGGVTVTAYTLAPNSATVTAMASAPVAGATIGIP